MPHSPAVEKVDFDARRVERVYAALARVYDGFFDWALGPGRVEAVRALGCRPGDRVLEIGVGTGLSFPCYPAGTAVTGIDISAEMLRRAEARRNSCRLDEVELRRMDARSLQFEDASFERVLAPYVVSVVPEPARVMAEIARVCRPGGTVVVVNHFGSRNRVLARMESALSPVSQWIGFRMDLPMETITGTPDLRLLEQRRVNLLGLWQLLRFERRAPDQ